MRMMAWIAAALVWIAGTAWAAGTEGAEPGTLTVLTYNIHIGKGMDGKLDLERIARVIRESKADLVALEEVDVKTRRTGGVDQAAELARLTGMHAHFARAMDHDGGAYGVAILSRHAILEAKTHALGGEPGSEPRAAAEAHLRLGPDGPRIVFFATHLEHRLEPLRLKQVAVLEKATAAADAPIVILAGDFNAEPGSAPMRALADRWKDTATEPAALTCPADKPRMRIDYILYRPAKNLKVVESKVIDEPVASDHRPVRAVLSVGKGE